MSPQEDRSRFGGSRVVVRETDDYLNRRGEEEEEKEPPNNLVYTLFQPAIVTVLIGCITWSVAQLSAPLIVSEGTDPLGVALFVWAVSILMTFVGFKTQRRFHGPFAKNRIFSGGDATRARLIELALLFFGVKLLNHLGDTLPQLLQAIQNWANSPLTFFDARSLVAYGIGVVGWLAAGMTARDMDELIDPMGVGSGETDPRERVVNRYFLGGGILIIFTALNRVNVESFLQMTHARISTPVGNVLLYFFLGVLMLGHLQWLRLTTLWSRQKVGMPPNLAPTWLRFTLLFVAVAALIAFLLPTGYTVGIMDLVSMALMLISYLATLLYLILLWPFIMLLSLFMGNSEGMAPPQMEEFPFAPPPEAAGAEGSPWWAVIRSVLFWVTLVIVVIVLIRSYIRDRPGFMDIIRRFAPWQWLHQAWRGIRDWLSTMGSKLPGALPALVQRLRSAASRGKGRTPRTGGRSPREQIIYHYLTTLDQAQERGVGRRPTETPYEYREKLMLNLVEEQEALDSLTEAFVAARYSTYRFTSEEIKAAAAHAAALRQRLKADKRDPE